MTISRPWLAAPRLTMLLAGGLSATGFAPLGLWPVGLLCFALLFAAIEAAPDPRSAFTRGWLFGLGQFTIGLNWIATAFTFQAAMPAWLGWIAIVLLSFYLAVYPGLATWIAYRIAGYGRNHGAILVVSLAGAWIVTEWMRAWVISGFAWNPLGVMLVDYGWAARWIGTYGLGALVIMLAGGLFLAARREFVAAAIMALVPVSISGLAATIGAPTLRPEAKSIAITVVQPNISQADKWEDGFREENFSRLARETLRADTDSPRLVFWPEAAIPDYIEDGYPPRYTYPDTAASNRARIASLIGPDDLLITGGVKLYFDAQGVANGAANSVFVIDPAANILGSYNKSHLVPFGEYLPLEDWLGAIGLSRLVPGALPFTPGPGPSTLQLPGFGSMGLQICYEIIFSGHVVDAAHRPDFLFNPSNDAWFGRWGPPQHLAQARLRALEEAMPIIRSTPTGISAVIDTNGTLVADIGAKRAGHIDSHLPPPAHPTIFARFGNILPLSLAFALLLIGVALSRRRR